MWYKVNLQQPVSPEGICSHGCMENRCGLCPHVAAAVMNWNDLHLDTSEEPLVFKDFLPRWQWLATWAEQLGVPVVRVSEEDDLRYFPLPNLADVAERMQKDTTLDRTCVMATAAVIGKGQIGRMKGSVEEMGKRKKRLAAEVASGATTGVTTTPLDAPLPKKPRQTVCKWCTGTSTIPVLTSTCGGGKKKHMGSEAGRRKAEAELEEQRAKIEREHLRKQGRLEDTRKQLEEAKGASQKKQKELPNYEVAKERVTSEPSHPSVAAAVPFDDVVDGVSVMEQIHEALHETLSFGRQITADWRPDDEAIKEQLLATEATRALCARLAVTTATVFGFCGEVVRVAKDLEREGKLKVVLQKPAKTSGDVRRV